MAARLFASRVLPRPSFRFTRGFSELLPSIEKQPKLASVPLPAAVTERLPVSASDWLPRRFRQGLPETTDGLNLFDNIEVLKYPLPVYSTPEDELAAKELTELQNDVVEHTEPTPLQKYGVFPVTALGLAGLMANEIVMLHEEAIVAGSFLFVLTSGYVLLRDAFYSSMAERAQKIRDQHVQGLESVMAANSEYSKELEKQVAMAAEFKKLMAGRDEMKKFVVAAMEKRFYRSVREQALTALDTVVKFERDWLNEVSQNVLKGANSYIQNRIRNDNRLRQQVMDRALGALAGNKTQSDVLAKLYAEYFRQLQLQFEAMRVKGIELSDQERQAMYFRQKGPLNKLGAADKQDPIADVPKVVKLPEYSRVIA
eukprot:TRINITY_DN1855_c0_g1_i1.p1 TRINITY_DN1855_c0_g1~~TRINITY_DN1855_c0_g1_i1.p1  ORF type:complete len:370 (-),score=159.43 TRINITY_DN1855_c0_g1_i1:176-1285(-)